MTALTALTDLAERLTRAQASIHVLASEAAGNDTEHARLSGKSDGISLALSYVEEALRPASDPRVVDAALDAQIPAPEPDYANVNGPFVRVAKARNTARSVADNLYGDGPWNDALDAAIYIRDETTRLARAVEAIAAAMVQP